MINRRQMLVLMLGVVPGGAAWSAADVQGPSPPPASSSGTGTVGNAQAALAQGWAPSYHGLALAPDGRTAWVAFSLDDALLEVDLTIPAVRRAVDVSAAGIMLNSTSVVLSPDGARLFVPNYSTGNLMVVNTAAAAVERVLAIPPSWSDSVAVSSDGTRLYVATYDGALAMVALADFSMQKFVVPGNDFRTAVPSRLNPNRLYCLGGDHFNNLNQNAIWLFDTASGSVVRKQILTSAVWSAGLVAWRLVPSVAEDVAWIGWFRHNADQGQGNLSVIDLSNFNVLATVPIDYGVTDMAVDEKAGKIYAIGFWSGGGAPQTLPIVEWDIQERSISRRLPISPTSDQRAIALGSTGTSVYVTDGDSNYLVRVDLTNGAMYDRLQFNQSIIRPYSFIPAGDDAYIACHGSPLIYRLRLATGEVATVGALPSGAGVGGGCYFAGLLYFVQGRDVYHMNPQTGATAGHWNLPMQTVSNGPVLVRDRFVLLNLPSGATPQLVVLNPQTMQVEKTVDLPNDVYPDMPLVSPDGSKVYVSRGPMFGPPYLMIFSTADWSLRKTMVIETPQRSGATSFLDGDFDQVGRVLYLTGFSAIWSIQMDTDEVLGTATTGDIFGLLGCPPGWSLTGLCGARLSADSQRLFVVSGDAHSLCVYDTIGMKWLPELVNLKGYFITDVVQSADRRYLYTANEKSDTITMVDTDALSVAKVIGPLSGPVI
jgi:DNA-binding beta-propeller fold protein YncE